MTCYSHDIFRILLQNYFSLLRNPLVLINQCTSFPRYPICHILEKKISFLLLIMIQPIKQFRHFLDYHGPDSVVWFLFSFFLFLLCWFRWFSYDNVRNLIFLSIQATSTVFLRFVCCRSEIIYLDEIVLGCKDSISFGFSRDFCVTLFLIARLR